MKAYKGTLDGSTKVTQYGFTGLFTLELALRFMAFGFKELWYSDEWGWILLDMVIVLTSLVDMSVTLAIRSGGVSQWNKRTWPIG